jgi:creatinine amidohydrolase
MSLSRLDSSVPSVSTEDLLLVPVGSYEQHGPHLPYDTDAVIAVAVTTRVAAVLGAPVAPVLAYGSSGEHQGFPGTLSIGTSALHIVLVELVRSASTWAKRVVFVNGHGGNLDALRSAIGQLRVEGHDTAWVPCAVPGADAHAGHVETSLLLHLDPARVDLTQAVAGNCEPLERLLPAMRAGGVRAVSPSGVLGDPRTATAAAGAALLENMVTDVLARMSQAHPDATGCLIRTAS